MIDDYIHDYIFSGSLPENASTYVKREADDELYEALQQGKFCYVLNSRQSGKSSLRLRTMSRLSKIGVECASIDLSSINIQSATQENWYADLITKLIDSFVLDVDFEDWWNKKQLNSPLLRFTHFIEKHLLAEITEDIVIFIDEIDSVLSLNFPTDDFFAFIRACYNQRVDNPAYNRLTFCLLGVASPSNLIQDKNRTPFNIGKAISLKGFKLEEAEPLERGLRGTFSDSLQVMQEVLNWTGGQPFLTQKLCQFMVEESEKEKPRTVEQVVKSRIIESWESQDEPEHLRTIRARILRNEERAAYLLELYQQIRCSEQQSEIKADNTIEQSELLISGLVTRRNSKIRVYNLIYKEIFNQNWIENELNNLRPYSESFRFWVASGGKDESRLLRGKALVDAEDWAKDKNLSYQDKQFLAAGREKEIQEKIAVEKQEARLERERKDKEAVEKRNLVLSEANIKAKRRIRNGTVVLVLALLGAVGLGGLAAIEGNKALIEGNKALQAKEAANNAKKEVLSAKKEVENEKQNALKAQETANNAKKEANKANQNLINANAQAKKQAERVEVLQKQASQAQRNADDANLKATEATEKAEAEQQKAQKAQQDLTDANRKVQEAGEKAEKLQKIAVAAERKAKEAKQEAKKLGDKLEREQKEFEIVKKDVETVQDLSKLAGKLRSENLTSESDEALRQAGLSFRVDNHHLKQAMLFASQSQAYQSLANKDETEEQKDKNTEYQKLASDNLAESLKYLKTAGNKISSTAEGSQIKVLVKVNEGKLRANKSKQEAINAYQTAYQTLKNHPDETNPFLKDKILTTDDIESVHRGLLNLQPNPNKDVWNSLKEHFYARLENSLKPKDWRTKDWRTADLTTDRLMLFIADREDEGFLNIRAIEKFSCSELKRMDSLWVNNSGGNFGFSVQKEIWVKTGLRLGVKPEEKNQEGQKLYINFASAVGWYNGKKENERQSGWMQYSDYIDVVKNNPSLNKIRGGGLPIVSLGYGGLVGRDWEVGYRPSFLYRRFSRCDL